MEHAYLPSALDTPEADLFVPYLKDERRHHIEKMLAASDQGFVRSTILARQFEVSVVTVKRDLLALERAGVARCVRGGATALLPPTPSPAVPLLPGGLTTASLIEQAQAALQDDDTLRALTLALLANACSRLGSLDEA